jgi:hypothetical protein
MKATFSEKTIAYLALLSGLTLSAVAEYYSILGLTAIFSAAVIPIVIMGIALGVGKVTATVWLKQNWKISPFSIKLYLFIAIMVLMAITSMGTFGFLSKAHSDQSLISGDVQSKLAIYDEKIKTQRENIETDRKALAQMDAGVDQLMSRSNDQNGADRAVSLRRSQTKERQRLLEEISNSQQTITHLNEERAPIAAENRKVEAEVGPIKYIAAFVYGATDQTVLERAVTWVIILIIVVFDPLALILLLASQSSFQNFRNRNTELVDDKQEEIVIETPVVNDDIQLYDPDNGPLTDEDIQKIKQFIGNIEMEDVTPALPEETESTSTDAVYVQNEEQSVSNLWSSSTVTISQDEYLEKSRAAKGL